LFGPSRSGTLAAILSEIAGSTPATTAKDREGHMAIVAKVLIALVALEHIYFLVLETSRARARRSA
jgi:hypothetical protein